MSTKGSADRRLAAKRRAGAQAALSDRRLERAKTTPHAVDAGDGAPVQARDRGFELLSEVAGDLLRSRDPKRIVDSLCRKVMAFLGCDTFLNYMADADRKRLHLNACEGIPEETARRLEWLEYGNGSCGCLVRDGGCTILECVQESEDPNADPIRSLGLQTYACYSLQSSEGAIGTLAFGSRSRSRFRPGDLPFMKAVADHVAIAMDRVIADDRLRENEARYRVMGETIPYGVWLCDARGRVQYVSPSFLELLDMTEDEVRALGWWKRLPPEEVGPMKERWLLGVKTGRQWDEELRIRDREGTLRTVLSRGRPVRDADGRITCWVGINLDISERKKVREELTLRTRELEWKSRELARSNTELQGFVHAASHDLRSPLLSINGCVQLLEEMLGEQLNDESRELFAHAKAAVSHMGELLRSLLDYSRLGAAQVQVTECPLDKIIDQVRTDLRAQIKSSGAVIVHETLPVLCADARLLAQLLQNLIENAIKYRSESVPHIRVAAEDRPDDWLVSVSDNGVGIEPKHFERIFQIFQRVSQHDQTRAGVGIGLAICKKIVERHYGRIWVESRPGEGSTFFFTIRKPVIG